MPCAGAAKRRLGTRSSISFAEIVKPSSRTKVAVSPAVAVKVAAAATRVGMSKEQALEIAAAEPRHATIFAGLTQNAKGAQRFSGRNGKR